MRVTNQNLTGASLAGTSNTSSTQDAQKSSNSSSSATTGSGGDTVELSSTLGTLARAMQSFDSSRQNMVQSLASQYQSGTYMVDSTAISRGMISEALSG